MKITKYTGQYTELLTPTALMSSMVLQYTCKLVFGWGLWKWRWHSQPYGFI